ncbi:glycoside hydrolase family 65 protein, partial [Lactobacillus crispatus]|nr:glycoside hydrolase family 65 protein [Lactobacillus crispatus]
AKLSEKLSVELDQGQSYELEKDVIVVTSRDIEEKDQADVAEDFMKKLQTKSFEENLAEHTATWKKRWETSDVEIDG